MDQEALRKVAVRLVFPQLLVVSYMNRSLCLRRLTGIEKEWVVKDRGLHRPPGLAIKRSVFMPKREYELRANAPSKFSLRDLSLCIGLVRKGNAVDPASAAVKLPRSKILALALAGNLVIGVGAIKRRRPGYVRQIAEGSGVSFDPNTSELGYIAVDPEHRGQRLSERIVGELLAKHDGALFATTSSERMKRTLARVGFVERGHTWPGRNGEQLSLWIKETQALPLSGSAGHCSPQMSGAPMNDNSVRTLQYSRMKKSSTIPGDLSRVAREAKALVALAILRRTHRKDK